MIRVNVADISESESRSIGVTIADAVRAFYSDPERVKEFKEWRKSSGHQRESICPRADGCA